MILYDSHYITRHYKILNCKNSTLYTDENIQAMNDSSALIFDFINEINNKTFIVDEKELIIEIDNIKFFHNCMMIYANINVLKYIRYYIFNIVKLHNDTVKKYNCCKKALKYIDIKLSTNGYGTGLICNYDCFSVKN